jgi:hypothetical protein
MKIIHMRPPASTSATTGVQQGARHGSNRPVARRDVIRNSATIVREFGLTAYGRCVRALVVGRPRTFLAAVQGRAPASPGRYRGAVIGIGAAIIASTSVAVVRPMADREVSCVASCTEGARGVARAR